MRGYRQKIKGISTEGPWQESEEQYTRWNCDVKVIKPRRYDGSDMQHTCGQQENVQEIRNGKIYRENKFKFKF